MSMNKPLHLILTGPPGIGKTTLVTKLCNLLKTKPQQYSLYGFYTSELRNSSGSNRIGFQIITVDEPQQSGTLSSITSKSTKRVGQYGVEIEEFEAIALPQFVTVEQSRATSANSTTINKPLMKKILIIDEIGKMELFSTKFKQAVLKAFEIQDLIIIATIPIQGRGKPIEFVENIRTNPNTNLFTVNVNNRNELVNELFNTIQQGLQ